MDPAQLYRDYGATHVINAAGYQTVLGGSRLSPEVQEAMIAANRYYVEMDTLLRSTGEEIAHLLGSEAAMVTPGCAAALALSTAACMSHSNPTWMEQLPDTTGIPNEFLFQFRQHYHYERCLTVFGGKLVEVGTAEGTTREQLEAMVGKRTAGMHYYASGDKDDSILNLTDVLSIARSNSLPVTVDAAYQVFPLDTFRQYASSGGMVGFGAKYIGACNSTGILCGPKYLIDAAYMHSFLGFETSDYETVGRPLKLDRQEIIAVVVALKHWLQMDHNARIEEQWRRADLILDALRDVPSVAGRRHVEENSLSNGVMLRVDEAGLKCTTPEIVANLKQGDPSIWTRSYGDCIRVAVAHLVEDELEILITRLRQQLAQ